MHHHPSPHPSGRTTAASRSNATQRNAKVKRTDTTIPKSRPGSTPPWKYADSPDDGDSPIGRVFLPAGQLVSSCGSIGCQSDASRRASSSCRRRSPRGLPGIRDSCDNRGTSPSVLLPITSGMRYIRPGYWVARPPTLTIFEFGSGSGFGFGFQTEIGRGGLSLRQTDNQAGPFTTVIRARPSVH